MDKEKKMPKKASYDEWFKEYNISTEEAYELSRKIDLYTYTTEELISELKRRGIEAQEEWTKDNRNTLWWFESDANGRKVLTLLMPKED